MTFLHHLLHFFVTHDVHFLHQLPVVGRLDAPHEGHGHRHGFKAGVEEEQSNVGVHSEELGHVEVVGESGAQTNHVDHHLGALDLGTDGRKFGVYPGLQNFFIFTENSLGRI